MPYVFWGLLLFLYPYMTFFSLSELFNPVTKPDPHFSPTVHWWDFPIDSERWSEGQEATNRYHIPQLDGK